MCSAKVNGAYPLGCRKVRALPLPYDADVHQREEPRELTNDTDIAYWAKCIYSIKAQNKNWMFKYIMSRLIQFFYIFLMKIPFF